MTTAAEEKAPAQEAPPVEQTGTDAETPTEAKNPLLDKPIELKAKAVTQSRFVLAEEVRHIWRCTVEQDVTPEQVMNEGFWANVGMLLTPGDEIHVLPDNYAWRLDLHVAGAGRLFAHVIKLQQYDLRPAMAPVKLPSIYKVEYAGAHHKWRVLREGGMLKDGFATESIVAKYAKNHEGAVNRGPQR